MARAALVCLIAGTQARTCLGGPFAIVVTPPVTKAGLLAYTPRLQVLTSQTDLHTSSDRREPIMAVGPTAVQFPFARPTLLEVREAPSLQQVGTVTPRAVDLWTTPCVALVKKTVLVSSIRRERVVFQVPASHVGVHVTVDVAWVGPTTRSVAPRQAAHGLSAAAPRE